MNINKIRQNSKKIKLEIFKKFIEIKEGHPGSILSIFDVVSLANLLLNYINKYNLNNKIVCNAISEKIDFGNDGREALLHRNNLSSDKIKTIIEKYI